MNPQWASRVWLALLLIATYTTAIVEASRPGWQRLEVDWRMTGGSRIRAISYPPQKPPMTLAKKRLQIPTPPRKRLIRPEAVSRMAPTAQQPITPIVAMVIDSPPIEGFAPWIAVTVTDARSYLYLDSYAVMETSVTGNYLTSNPESDYAIGLFDTGASTNLISDEATVRTGVFDYGLVTSEAIELIGATGSAFAWISHPLGIFVNGLSAVDSNSLLLDDSTMVGESNVSIIVGDPNESPDLPTAIGAPLAIYFSTVFYNDREITVTRDSNDFTAPDIRIYDHDDPNDPNFPGKIILELRPTDVGEVWYFPCIEIPGFFDCPDGDGSPLTPTIIADDWFMHQGLFFVSEGVDLTKGNRSATEKMLMFDTGAQVTVISESVGIRLELFSAEPDFEVEIKGATGEVITAPGYYIDSLEIPASPEYLSFTDVPVVVLNVDSPEGGYLDGIIGMNLFVDLNFVFHGGGIEDDVFIKFEPICWIIGDIAPEVGDCVVNFLDLAVFVDAWLATEGSGNWNPDCDMAPPLVPDGKVDLSDFGVLAEHW